MEAELGEGAKVETLIERLGTPESYAAELRASGGYPPPEDAPTIATTPPKPHFTQARLALWGLAFSVVGLGLFAFAAAVSVSPRPLLGLLLVAPVLLLSALYVIRHGVEPLDALPEVAGVRTWLAGTRQGRDSRALVYLRSLKPAWWVLCAVALVGFGLLLMLRSTNAVLMLPVLIVLAAAIVWAGPRTTADRRLWWLAVPVSAFVVGALLGGFGAVIDVAHTRGSYPYQSYPSSSNYNDHTLSYSNNSVENVYAFDAEGKPLSDVYLYDQNGRPLSVARYGCEPGTGGRMKLGEDNRFPRPRVVQGVTDDRGNFDGYNGYRPACREEGGVPFSAAIPKVTTPPASATSPAPTTTATPTPTK